MIVVNLIQKKNFLNSEQKYPVPVHTNPLQAQNMYVYTEYNAGFSDKFLVMLTGKKSVLCCSFVVFFSYVFKLCFIFLYTFFSMFKIKVSNSNR